MDFTYNTCDVCGSPATCWNVNGHACDPAHLRIREQPKYYLPIRTRPWSQYGLREEVRAEQARRAGGELDRRRPAPYAYREGIMHKYAPLPELLHYRRQRAVAGYVGELFSLGEGGA